MVPLCQPRDQGDLPTSRLSPMTQDHQPAVSAIIPARNEGPNIARAVQSLAIQTDIREIIVIDDQSQDQTAEILANLALRCKNLLVLRLDHPRVGWLENPPAAAAGARRAPGNGL